MNTPAFLLRRLVPLLLVAVAPALAQAQVVTASPQVAVYRYAEPGQPTMDVRVWGSVRTPGIYQVEHDTDLIEMLSLAGGPVLYAERPGQEQTVHVQLSRGQGNSREVIFRHTLDELVTSSLVYPELQHGDVLSVEIDVEQPFNWRDGLTIFSSIGTVAVIILNIIRLS